MLLAKVLLASCAIPVAFPPVLFPVVDEQGNEYDELHTDGAASLQMLINIPIQNATVYAIANKIFNQSYRPVDTDVFEIGNGTLGTVLSYSIIGELYRLYVQTLENNNSFQATWIPEDFAEVSTEIFDTDYMRALYNIGYESALLDSVWHNKPPYM